jgi:lysophospholipase L1-like esterase
LKKIIFYNLLIITLIIFFLEVSLRIFSSLNELGFDKNLFNLESKIRVHNKNIKSKVFGKKVFTDSNGFRVPTENYTYSQANKSSIIMGDSVSFGVGVLEEKTFVGLLRNKHPNINFFNSSVSGSNVETYLELLTIYSENFNYDNVIIFYCINDIVQSKGVLTKKDFYKKNYIAAKINVFLRNKSLIYIYLKSIITDPEKGYYEYIAPSYKDETSLYDLTQSILAINKITLEKDKKLHFVILPYEYQTREKNCNNKYLFPQNKLTKILTNNKIEYSDFSKDFCDYDSPKKLFLTFDPVHLSVTGHKFVFDLIQKEKITN